MTVRSIPSSEKAPSVVGSSLAAAQRVVARSLVSVIGRTLTRVVLETSDATATPLRPTRARNFDPDRLYAPATSLGRRRSSGGRCTDVEHAPILATERAGERAALAGRDAVSHFA